MRRAMLIVLFALFGAAAALTLGSSAAGASTGDPVGLDQSQSLLNQNSTSQQSDAEAGSEQVNVNIPISVLSPGANQGDVHQSNDAVTTAESGNANSTDQSIDGTEQDAVAGPAEGGEVTQSQDVANANETSQDSSATATTKQQNVNLPIAVLSPGANQGDVDQSNAADTSATSTNDNATDQSITDTSQQAAVEGGHGRGPGGTIAQHQDVGNANETSQDSTATATTGQQNLNLPVAILGSSWDRGGKDHGKGPSGCGCDDRDGWKPGRGHAPAPRGTGDVTQSNDAATTATSGNTNTTDQSVADTSQQAKVDGDSPWHDGPKGPKHDGPKGPKHDGGNAVRQHQDVGNANGTDQDSTATATTGQRNVNRPVVLGFPAGHRDDRPHRNGGKQGCDRCDHGRPTHPSPAPAGDVHQTNDAGTAASSGNTNATDQSISGTSQQAKVEGGRDRPEHHGERPHHGCRREEHRPAHRC